MLSPQDLAKIKTSKVSITPDLIETMKAQSFAVWAHYSNLVVDSNRKLTFPDHRYLIPIYADNSSNIVVMKAAQLGLTIWLVLRLLWHCSVQDIKAAFYFPTKEDVERWSKDRLTPLILNNPSILKHFNPANDSLRLKRFGNSSLYVNYMGGVASKDSAPIDVMAFDEVRLMAPEDIDQASERVSHSPYKIKYMASTAGYPGTDIHGRFLLSDQYLFHTKCKCPDGILLAHTFPNCVAERANGEVYLECPKCQTKIDDPQNGLFLRHGPKDSPIRGYHIHQLLSQHITLKEIWHNYKTTTTIKEFYNAKLGLPWIDKENIPIKDETLAKCSNANLPWLSSSRNLPDVCMGVDQMAGLNVVVVAQRLGTKKRILALDWIEEDNPFPRLYQLMDEYNIRMAVVDAQPNANEALAFAKAFKQRVYLAYYVNSRDMVAWGGTTKEKSTLRPASEDTKYKYRVMLDRYQSLDYTFQQFEKGNVEIPDPRGLQRSIKNPKTGRKEPTLLCQDVFFKHLKSVVREQVITNEDTDAFRMQWKHIEIDPHFAHATNYCFFAIERLKKQFMVDFIG